MVTLTLPASLAALLPPEPTGPDGPDTRYGRSIAVDAEDWAGTVEQIQTRFPRLADRVLTPAGEVRTGFLVAVNDAVGAPGQRPEVRAGDEVFLFAQIAGGATVRGEAMFEGLGTGKRARLHRMLFRHGVGNGMALFLPYDQGLEHGPRDFAGHRPAGDPAYVVKLAVEGGFNAIAMQIGLARRFYWEYAGEVPLILKLNGKTEIPPDDEALSPLNATVEEAVGLGADAVGYTLYVGSPRQADDFAQLRQVRADAERYGMPLVVWSYPRGSAIRHRGGRESFYAVDYAARVAAELGADIVKLNWPDGSRREGVPAAYDRTYDAEQMLDALVRSAGRSLVLLSGGEKTGEAEILGRAETALRAGAVGVIFGRNVWQREYDDSLRFVARLRELLQRYPRKSTRW